MSHSSKYGGTIRIRHPHHQCVPFQGECVLKTLFESSCVYARYELYGSFDPFFQLLSASASQSWYVRHARDLALEVVNEKIPDSLAVVDYDPFKMILHNLNLTLPTGSRCVLIGENGSGKSMLLRILGGRNLTPPQTQMFITADDETCGPPLSSHQEGCPSKP